MQTKSPKAGFPGDFGAEIFLSKHTVMGHGVMEIGRFLSGNFYTIIYDYIVSLDICK